MVQSSNKTNQRKTLRLSSITCPKVNVASKKIKKVAMADQASKILKEKMVEKNAKQMQK